MPTPKLLIALPTKTGGEYFERAAACLDTWLSGDAIDRQFFSDFDMGLNSRDKLVRQQRMKVMCKHALTAEYDFLYRVDTDAYVHLDRLLASDAFTHEAWGWGGNNSLNGGLGFMLSRKAMQAVVDAGHFIAGRATDGGWYGDMWTAAVLHRMNIKIGRTDAMQDGAGSEDIQPEQVRPGMITIHPMMPETMRRYHETVVRHNDLP